ncbi:hypothetical protein P5V15_003961 [Pogonomyrmex californicus]
MILLFLSWPQTRCIEDIDLKGTESFDQLATASETIVHAVKKPDKDSKDLQAQPSRISSSISAGVHYENSNGFVPILPSMSSVLYDPSSTQTNSHEQQKLSQSEESNATNAVSAQDSLNARAEKLEEDLANSSEARIFLSQPGSLTNRRSFDFQDERLNEFELLKVNNDTPAVANFQEFYENVHDTDTDSEPEKSSTGRHQKGERGKRLEKHTRNYGRQSQQSNGEDIYAQFYAQYNNGQDTKKTVYGQEKVAGNYQQQSIANYNGQSAAKQNAAAVPSSSRTSYETNELTHGGTYGDAVESPRTRQRFLKPVVVADPSNYKVDAKFSSQLRNSESDNDYKTLRNLESSSSETLNHYDAYNSRQRSYQRTEDSKSSDESTEYSDYIERPRARTQKNRKRPSYSDPSRKLPKEHRETLDESAEEGKHAYSPSKVKSQRYRVKANPWLNDPNTNHRDESAEDTRHDSRGTTKTKNSNVQHVSKNTNTWNQISPNIEISHSNGIELDQVEKPKYVVNLVPVTNFDHATALGGSQGFDVSNAMLQNIATVAPIGAFSTTAPILSTPQTIFAQNLALSKNLAVSTPVPDIIVGQNSFQSPVHTILVSPSSPNKIIDPLRATYVPSTMTPVFALTPGLSPMLQSVSVHGVRSNVTPRPTFAVVPQPTVQTYPSFLQTPLQATQLQVNTHGLQDQNLITHGNLQVQSLPTAPTLLASQTIQPEGRANAEVQSKKNAYPASGPNFLATASLAVGQNGQKQATNTYYIPSQNAQQVNMASKTKTFVQATQVVPAIQQLIPNQQNLQELHAQMNKQLAKNGRLPGVVLQTADSAASHSISNLNTVGTANAHLPNIGAKNVEIVNPNIKSNPLNNMNPYQMMHYPATVVTTPNPIFSTIASVTPQTAVNLQNYVSSLTESGAKKQVDLKPSQNQEPMFNPINFVPNVDIIKNQNALNNKPHNEPVQQGLNLVPAMPGGNFFKPYSGQGELLMKPKLTSDLQKYAEEMFKESLKTMYNSQKWNNDRRPQGSTQNYSEANDLAKLRIELQKLRTSLAESKYRDIIEAHQSENNVRTANAPKSKKKDPLLATLEHLLKTRPAGPIHIYHGPVKSGRKPKLGDSNFAASTNYDDFNENSHLEFLSPPRPSPFYDKPMKKRPGPRYKNGLRKPMRPGSSFRSSGIETSASNVDIYMDGPQYHKSPTGFDSESFDYDARHRSSHESYPTFTTSTPEIVDKILREIKMSNNKGYDINHPRMHNLLGLLMKNKQLPTRGAQNYFRDRNQLRQFFERDRRRLQQQFYGDALKNYMDRSDIASQSASVTNRNVYSGNSTA